MGDFHGNLRTRHLQPSLRYVHNAPLIVTSSCRLEHVLMLAILLIFLCAIGFVIGLVVFLVKAPSLFFSLLTYLAIVAFLIALPLAIKIEGAAIIAAIAPIAVPVAVIASLWTPFYVWTLSTFLLLAASVRLLLTASLFGRALLPVLLGVITGLAPALAQTSWTKLQMSRAASRAGLTCIVAQPISTSLIEGLSIDAGFKPHFHAVAFKNGEPWNWSFRAHDWHKIPASNILYSQLIADHRRSDCAD